MAQLCLWTKSGPQMRQFCMFTYPPRSIWASSEKIMFFFGKIAIFCKSIAGPVSEAKTHWMANWLQLLHQLNFVSHYTKVFMQNSSQWCLRNVPLLRTTVNWCWWRFTQNFCRSNNILGCTTWFWLFKLWLIDEEANFLHFFHNITNIKSWRCFSSSKIRTQFAHTFCNKVMSQYFAALFERIHNHISEG